jgi:multiple sugar transport system permease protein
MSVRAELDAHDGAAVRRRNVRRLEKAFLTVLMVTIAILMFLPFLWMISSSFKPYREILALTPTIIPKKFTLVNYQTILTKLPFLRYFLNSFGISATITLAVLFTSSLCGYVFAKFQFAFKEVFFTLIVSSMMVPFAVIVLPLYLFVARMGLVNTYVGLILPSMLSGFGIFLMRQFMEGIPSELVDAGRIDGASDMWIYWKVMIPLSLNALSALAVFTFLWAWNSLWWAVMIITRPDMRPLPLGIASLAWEFGVRTDLVITGAAIAVVPVLILFAMMTRTVVQGVALTGMK